METWEMVACALDIVFWIAVFSMNYRTRQELEEFRKQVQAELELNERCE